MKVCYFTADFSGAGCYRCLFPGQELTRQFGHECFVPEPKEVRPGLFQFELGRVPSADVYVLQQRPERAWLKLIPFLRDRGKIVVCETDDYYLGIPEWHPAYDITRPLVKDLHRIYGLANAMTVSTPFLEREYRKYNENIHLLPNYWDREMWESVPERDWDRVRVGWMGVSRMRPQDLEVLKGVVAPFLRSHPDVDFVAAGDPQVHEILGVPEAQRVTVGQVKGSQEVSEERGKWGHRLHRVHFPQTPELMRFDIGLVPLSPHDFNEGKSYLKGMEYNIAGIPYVASPTEPYREYTDVGENGFLAERTEDWLGHLEELVGDEALRRRMGRDAKAKAEAFTIQEHAWRWNEVYESLLGDRWDQAARDAIDRLALQKPEECASFLRFLAARRPPKVVVEIGTAQGGMLHALAQVAADDATIISIDFPGGDLQGTVEDVYGDRDTDKMSEYVGEGQSVEFLQMNSQIASTRATLERILAGRKIDLLFIDGDHSYVGVKADFENYVDFVAPDGVIAFHDIQSHDAADVEVDRYWNEIKGDYVYEEFVFDGDWGWGVWGGIGVLDLAASKKAVAA